MTTTKILNLESTQSIRAIGLIVTWTPNGDAELGKIVEAFEVAGFGDFTPTARTKKDALRWALVARHSRVNNRVAPTGNGYELITETPVVSTTTVEYNHVMSAWINEDDTVGCDDPARLAEVQSWVAESERRIDGGVMSQKLSAVVRKLNGVSIRANGGAYWLPEKSAAPWLALVEAFKKAGSPMRLQSYSITGDPETVDALVGNVEDQIKAQVANIEEMISDPTQGAKALGARYDEIEKLSVQLGAYKSSLGRNFEALSKYVDDVELRAGQAAMAAQMAANQ